MDKICNITSKTLSLFPKIKKILNSEKKYLEISEKMELQISLLLLTLN